MSTQHHQDQGWASSTPAQLRDRFALEDAAQATNLLANGDPRRLPAAAELDGTKSIIRDACNREMAKLVGPFMITLKQVPIDLKNIFIAADKPAEITAKLARELRLQKRALDRVFEKLKEAKEARQKEVNGVIAAWRPSRRYRRVDRHKLMLRTIQLGIVETVINGAMLFTAQYRGGLLAALAASVLPSIINLGGGAFLGDILLRHIRRENGNRLTRAFSWKGICAILGLVVTVNTGFAYLRITGSIEGLIQYIITGRVDYTLPAIAGLGLLLFGWSTAKWWYSAHPNLQLEKLGRELEDIDVKIDCAKADIEQDANAAVRKAIDDINMAEQEEGEDISAATSVFGELVLLTTTLCQDLDAVQMRYEAATNDYSRMVRDALGPDVPDHYKRPADLSAARPGMPDMTSLKFLLDQLERDYRRLQANAAHARCELELEPERTMGWATANAALPPPRASNYAAGMHGSPTTPQSGAKPDGDNIKALPTKYRPEAAE